MSPCAHYPPPVTSIVAPDTKLAPSEHRNPITDATSSALPALPSGIDPIIPSCSSSESALNRSDTRAPGSVTITPGITAFTVIPHGPRSFASWFVSPMIPAFAPAYGSLAADGPLAPNAPFADIDDRFTILPNLPLLHHRRHRPTA